ncbi:hypothetical protein M8S60_00695 [Enterobacter asburiae]|uniref:hypothetical protein n=1 Tax=Enterobacter asburiae TaxID=61645 RepID=UPI0020766232|nr:hypothetical protein [Enterobacter asburiae]MCM7668181.1 hypothetical protein [Enterobacter asburiae]
MNNITNEQLDSLIKAAVNSSGTLPPDEKFSQIISALRELRDLRAAMLQGTENAESRCSNSPVIPDGWVMVPAEPTAEMLQSGISAHYERSQIQIHDRPAPGPMECAYVAMVLAAQQEEAKVSSAVIPGCSCRTCRPVTMTDMRFVVCPDCGNKRCPHANDHRNACTGSNEPGQEGDAYPAAPQQEVK